MVLSKKHVRIAFVHSLSATAVTQEEYVIDVRHRAIVV
jgi:hypothetical protein